MMDLQLFKIIYTDGFAERSQMSETNLYYFYFMLMLLIQLYLGICTSVRRQVMEFTCIHIFIFREVKALSGRRDYPTFLTSDGKTIKAFF